MILEIPVYHHPDGSRTIGQPDPRHGVKLGRIAMALNGPKTRPVERGLQLRKVLLMAYEEEGEAVDA